MHQKIEFSEVRSTEKWEKNVFDHENVTDFLSGEIESNGIHSIAIDNVLLELNVDLKRNFPLVIFLNGATARTEDLKLPIFSGLRVLPEGDVSRVYINDSSHYLDKGLTLGWYAGSANVNLQRDIVRIVEKISKSYSSRNVIFVGGSGGGFAALYFSKKIKGSLALVWNPQTNILNYWPKHVTAYAKAAFKIEGIEAANEKLKNHIDLDIGEIYSHNSSENFVIYLQNISDWHVEKHCAPFFKALGQEIDTPLRSGYFGDNIFLHAGDWGDGHSAPSPLFLKSLICRLLTDTGGWTELFDANLGQLLTEIEAPYRRK